MKSDIIMENIAVLDALERLNFNAIVINRIDHILNAHTALIEAAEYATCGGPCAHNRCQGLRDAVKLAGHDKGAIDI
jgi:hypothetical protein